MDCVKNGCGVLGKHWHPDESGPQSGVTLNIITSASVSSRHPCLLGAHAWAWAQSTCGGEYQRCHYCGRTR